MKRDSWEWEFSRISPGKTALEWLPPLPSLFLGYCRRFEAGCEEFCRREIPDTGGFLSLCFLSMEQTRESEKRVEEKGTGKRKRGEKVNISSGIPRSFS